MWNTTAPSPPQPRESRPSQRGPARTFGQVLVVMRVGMAPVVAVMVMVAPMVVVIPVVAMVPAVVVVMAMMMMPAAVMMIPVVDCLNQAVRG